MLQLNWLGPPEIKLDNSHLRLEMRKTLALLAYISLSSQPAVREKISAMFWPEYDEEHASSNLRRNLSSMNKNLPPNLLEINRDKVGFLTSDQVQVDVLEFRRLVAEVEEHHHTTDDICPECVTKLDTSINVYRADFLEGFNLKDCPEFDDWQYCIREELRELYGTALRKLALYQQSRGDLEKAISVARAWLARDRLNEQAQKLLIQLYLSAGKRSAANRQFDEYTHLLKQELGDPPEPELIRWFSHVQRAASAANTETLITREVRDPANLDELNLTMTKFYQPKAPRTLLHRQRLVNLLDRCLELPLTLITASAGFGKTTLLADWAAAENKLIAWVALDADDNDERRLAGYIIQAVRKVLPDTGIGNTAITLLNGSQAVQIPIIIGALINDLVALSEHLVLVLDDFHYIESQSALDVVNFFIDHCPSRVHLVISTRKDPSLLLARLKANHKLGVISSGDLRFTNDETQQFLTRAIGFPIDPSDLTFFEDKVEGWIAGIQLAVLAIQPGELLRSSADLHHFISAFTGSKSNILDYLIEEVLDRQPEEIRTFLMYTSILEKLSGPLCDTLRIGISTDEIELASDAADPAWLSSQKILEQLEKHNLFLVPLDDDRRWYRYHHLFAELLHLRFLQIEPKLEAQLHLRAARWYAKNAYSMEAVKHALDSGNLDYATDLIEEFSLKMIWLNQIVTTQDWFKRLPAETIQTRPLLQIYQAFILARRGEFERIPSIIENVEHYLGKLPNSPKVEEYRILTLGMKAFLANLQGEPETSLRVYSEIKPLIKDKHSSSYFLTTAQQAVAYLDIGDLTAAETVFSEMLEMALDNMDFYFAILTNKEIAEIYIMEGQLHCAEGEYRRMYEWIQQSFNDPALYNGLIRVYEARCLIERNELETASLLLQQDMETLLGIWQSSALFTGYVVLAELLISLGDFQHAQEAVQKAFQHVSSHNFYPRNVNTVQTCQVNLWLAAGKLGDAVQWADEKYPIIPADLRCFRELELISLGRIWVADQRWEQANELLQRLSISANKGKRYGRLLKIDILQAITLRGMGRLEEALELVEKCLNFASKENYLKVFLEEGLPLKELLQNVMKRENWQDKDLRIYTARILKAFGEYHAPQ